MTTAITLPADFCAYPGGRFRSDGPCSGEQFREDVLAPALLAGGVDVVLGDGLVGLPPSFIDEAFGGLVRSGMSEQVLRSRLTIRATAQRLAAYPDKILAFIAAAAAE